MKAVIQLLLWQDHSIPRRSGREKIGREGRKRKGKEGKEGRKCGKREEGKEKGERGGKGKFLILPTLSSFIGISCILPPKMQGAGGTAFLV